MSEDLQKIRISYVRVAKQAAEHQSALPNITTLEHDHHVNNINIKIIVDIINTFT